MLLEGIAVEVPKNAELNRSKAFVAAQQAINGWNGGELDDGRLGQLRAAARAEFGRRGYEATTIRDIAAAAGMSMGSVYRLIGSKDELLAAIMERFRNGAVSSWDAVLDAKATPVEKLDALLWVNINLLARFSEEFKIQFAWLRQSPPTSAFAINQITGQMYHVRTLLADGERRGYFRVIGKSAGVRAGCLFGLTFTAAAVGRGTRPQDALELGRNTLLRGAAVGV
jgi:AcrR family transcriptional regulator